jgi:hypothetical protein
LHPPEFPAGTGASTGTSASPAGDDPLATVRLFASLDRAGFLGLLGRHPRLAIDLLGDCARMVRLSNLRTVELAGSRVVARPARELLRLSREEGGRWIVRPAPTRERLARRLATTRDSVARAAGRLVRAGLLRRRGRTLELVDPRTPEAVAEGESTPDSRIPRTSGFRSRSMPDFHFGAIS